MSHHGDLEFRTTNSLPRLWMKLRLLCHESPIQNMARYPYIY
jgi:hypothetical protein